MEYIAFDGHKKYTLASVEDRGGRILREVRLDHQPWIFGKRELGFYRRRLADF